jgi:pyruvate/2-oxoacid:ferredoxin oxidoreductase beta subunit
MANIKEVAKIPERLSGGHRLCAGCGASIVVRQVLMGTKDPVVASCATGCLEVATTIYPFTAWKIPFIHNAFENSAATMSGVETAYRALKKKGKITKEIKFVAFGGDGGCYSDDTEVFTEDGFKNIKDIKVGDRIWSVNPETNELELQENEKLHKYPYEGAMIRGKSRFIDFLITPNHNVPMWYKGKWKFIKGIDLIKRYKTGFLRKFYWYGNGIKLSDIEVPRIPKHRYQKEFSKFETKKWLRFLGWYISEGSLYKSKSGYLIRIYQSNKDKKEKIYKLLQDLGLSPFKCNRSVDFQSRQIYEYLEKECGKGFKNKKIPKWALSLDRGHLRQIFGSLMEGDGSVTKQENRSSHHLRYITASDTLMNNMVELILKLGRNCNVSKRDGIYRIGIDNEYLKHKLYSRRRLYGDKQQVLLENYKGFVYCPQLKNNHTVIIKRNGKISLSGNSYDIGLQSLSGTLERGHKLVYVCYNNEAYMNTGAQRSGATPKGASTTTVPHGKESYGKHQFKKDLTSIVAAHKIPYAAQGSASHWNDLVTKAEKAFSADGPAFLNVIATCHRGWRFPQEKSIEISKLAVETGVWPLIEIENGVWRFTYKPKERKPVVEWLKSQGRFSHLFTEENKSIIDEIQRGVDENWMRLENLCNSTCKVA